MLEPQPARVQCGTYRHESMPKNGGYPRALRFLIADPRRASLGEEHETRMCADLQRSGTPAASRRVVNGNPGHAQTGLPLSAGLCVARVPVHTRATRGPDRSPTADGRARQRRTIRADPRQSATRACQRYATSLAVRRGHGGCWTVGRVNQRRWELRLAEHLAERNRRSYAPGSRVNLIRSRAESDLEAVSNFESR